MAQWGLTAKQIVALSGVSGAVVGPLLAEWMDSVGRFVLIVAVAALIVVALMHMHWERRPRRHSEHSRAKQQESVR